MNTLDAITEKFVNRSKEILGSNLVGIYLHGSAAMGCFNAEKSDIDLLVVINNDLAEEDKLRYMNMVAEMSTLVHKRTKEILTHFITALSDARPYGGNYVLVV